MSHNQTRTDIANLALGHVGQGSISSLEVDKSSIADLLRRYFELTRQIELETYDWSFARRVQALATAIDGPIGSWLFSYVMPADVLAVRGLQQGDTVPDPDSPIPYELVASKDGRNVFLHTDQPDAVLRYTFDQANIAVFTTNFIMAWSHRLASYIAYVTSKKVNIRDAQLGLAEVHRQLAQGLDGNASSKPKPELSAEWHRAREG